MKKPLLIALLGIAINSIQGAATSDLMTVANNTDFPIGVITNFLLRPSFLFLRPGAKGAVKAPLLEGYDNIEEIYTKPIVAILSTKEQEDLFTSMKKPSSLTADTIIFYLERLTQAYAVGVTLPGERNIPMANKKISINNDGIVELGDMHDGKEYLHVRHVKASNLSIDTSINNMWKAPFSDLQKREFITVANNTDFPVGVITNLWWHYPSYLQLMPGQLGSLTAPVYKDLLSRPHNMPLIVSHNSSILKALIDGTLSTDEAEKLIFEKGDTQLPVFVMKPKDPSKLITSPVSWISLYNNGEGEALDRASNSYTIKLVPPDKDHHLTKEKYDDFQEQMKF